MRTAISWTQLQIVYDFVLFLCIIFFPLLVFFRWCGSCCCCVAVTLLLLLVVLLFNSNCFKFVTTLPLHARLVVRPNECERARLFTPVSDASLCILCTRSGNRFWKGFNHFLVKIFPVFFSGGVYTLCLNVEWVCIWIHIQMHIKYEYILTFTDRYIAVIWVKRSETEPLCCL